MNDRQTTSTFVNAILIDLLAVGVVTTSLMAPGFAKILDLPLFKKRLDKRHSRSYQQNNIQYMKRQKLIEIRNLANHQYQLTITSKGKVRAQKAIIDSLVIAKPKKWDRKWHMVMFDIPEDKKTIRDKFTMKLRELGFYNLQRSVWIHPYHCEKEINILRDYYGVGQFVAVAEVFKIEQHAYLLEKFKNLSDLN